MSQERAAHCKLSGSWQVERVTAFHMLFGKEPTFVAGNDESQGETLETLSEHSSNWRIGYMLSAAR